MPNLNYVVGNWTIVSQENDTTPATKSFTPLPTLSYSADYSVASGATANDLTVINTTAATVLPFERIAYGRQDVSDIYKASRFDVPFSERLPVNGGIRLRVRMDELFRATNAVSGQEVSIPCAAWINVDLPKSAMVTQDMLSWIVKRLLSATSTAASTSPDLLARMARGDLDPTT